MLAPIRLTNAGSCPSRLAPIRPANAGSCPSRQRCFAPSASRSAETKGTAQLVLRTQAGRKEDATASLNLSVSPDCAATAAQSGETQGIPCALSRDERHCAASAAHSGKTKGEGLPLHLGGCEGEM